MIILHCKIQIYFTVARPFEKKTMMYYHENDLKKSLFRVLAFVPCYAHSYVMDGRKKINMEINKEEHGAGMREAASAHALEAPAVKGSFEETGYAHGLVLLLSRAFITSHKLTCNDH